MFFYFQFAVYVPLHLLLDFCKNDKTLPTE